MIYSNDDFAQRFKVYIDQLNEVQKNYEFKRKFRHIPEIIMNRGEIGIIYQEMAEDYIEHIPMPPPLTPNREGFKNFVVMLRTAFPDLHYEVDHLTTSDLIGEKQKVVHRIVAHGTHQGTWGPIPATGKRMTWSEIHIGLYVQGVLVEHWGNIDSLSIMQQMGVIPGWSEKPAALPPPAISGMKNTNRQENAMIVRSYIHNVWNKGRLEVADELVHPQCVAASLPELPVGSEGARQVVSIYREAFPDLHLDIEDLIAEEDVVAIRYRMAGTQQGVFMGIPPTDRDIEMDGCSIFRLGDGQIIQVWQEMDVLGLLGQLGMGGESSRG